MNASIRSIVVSFAVGAALLASPLPTLAQCGAGAEFATIGGGPSTEKLRVEVGAAHNEGAEIGRFWNSLDSNQANNFAGGCPSNDPTQQYGAWWKASGDAGQRGVRGVMGGPNCAASSCPFSDLTLVVEDWGASGPPGSGDTAYFVAMRVPPEAPGSSIGRRWDFAVVDNPTSGGASPTFVAMPEFPLPQIQSTTNLGDGELLLTIVYPDVAANVHALGADGQALPASSVVAGYRLYQFVTFGSEPGRQAAVWGEPIDLRPYEDGPALAEVVFSLPPIGASAFLALGLDFEGGSGPDVASALVGRALQIESGPPGIAIPAGGVAEEPLRIGKSGDGLLALSWGASCLAADFDYEIYSGSLGDFTSHAPVTCSTSGELAYELTAGGGDRYYLVVPMSPPDHQGGFPAEGSYGRNSDGDERPQNPLAACRWQALGDCP